MLSLYYNTKGILENIHLNSERIWKRNHESNTTEGENIASLIAHDILNIKNFYMVYNDKPVKISIHADYLYGAIPDESDIHQGSEELTENMFRMIKHMRK